MDEMLARLATFALFPLSIVPVNASRLARLGFYYSSPAQTLVCYRCRQTFNVDDQLPRLESHQQQCSSPAAAETPSTVSAPQQQTEYDAYQHPSSRLPTITSSEVTDPSSSPPTQLERSLTSGYKVTSRDETSRRNTDILEDCSTTSDILHNSVSSSPILRHQPDFERLKDETVRLSTFHDWPERAARIVEPRELARAGLFYTGQSDRVQCAYCRGYLRNWVEGDRPADEHRKHFPDCSFMRQMTVGGGDATAAATSSRSRASQHQLHTTRSTLTSDQSCYEVQQSFRVSHAASVLGDMS